ncbi:MAG: 2-succinyl-6-hydroxy-2,4-cyclohexadiene-1-carboxylate synthase [Acidimicrobiales bacterium]
MTVSRHRFDLDGGVVMCVEVSGAGPPVVLLHGFTGDASTMGVLTDRLVGTHTVIVPDLVGHGGSTGPADRHGVDDMAAQVVAVLEALGHPAPHDIVGYSMGGRVALTIACRHPELVASLSLIGASAGLATEAERAARRRADAELADSILADGLASFVDRWMANPLFATQARLGDEFLAEARAQRMGNDPEGLVRSLRGAGTGTMQPLHEHLGRCAMPIGLVVGGDDAKFRTIAEEMAGSLPDAMVSVIDGAGHAAHLERPDDVVAAIRRTLARATVRSLPLSIPLRGSHTTGRGTARRRDSVLVSLRANGHTGWGEASPLPGWSIEDLDAVRMALGAGAPVEPGHSGWDATAPWRASLAQWPSARAAVAGAALDLDARRAGLPLHRHLARWHPSLDPAGALDVVVVNALVSASDPASVATEVRRHRDAGTTTVKLKVGALEPDADLERVAAARAAGPDLALRLDANGAWDHDTAVSMLTRAADLGIVLCEEPVVGIEAIAAVGRAVAVPVAVDESVRSSVDLETVAAHADAIAALVVKPQALGGPDVAIDVILAARRAGLEIIVTSMIDSAVGLAHAAHVAAACGLGSAHGLATASMLAVDIAAGLPVVAGRIEMPTEPGLGIGPVSPGSGSPS